MVEDTFSSASLLEGMEASDGPKGVTVVRGQVRRKCGEGGGGAEWESLSGTEAKGRNKQSSAVFNLVPLPRGTLGRVWGPWRLTQRGGGQGLPPAPGGWRPGRPLIPLLHTGRPQMCTEPCCVSKDWLSPEDLRLVCL